MDVNLATRMPNLDSQISSHPAIWLPCLRPRVSSVVASVMEAILIRPWKGQTHMALEPLRHLCGQTSWIKRSLRRLSNRPRLKMLPSDMPMMLFHKMRKLHPKLHRSQNPKVNHEGEEKDGSPLWLHNMVVLLRSISGLRIHFSLLSLIKTIPLRNNYSCRIRLTLISEQGKLPNSSPCSISPKPIDVNNGSRSTLTSGRSWEPCASTLAILLVPPWLESYVVKEPYLQPSKVPCSSPVMLVERAFEGGDLSLFGFPTGTSSITISYWTLSTARTGESFSFLNIVDDATGFQVVSCLGTIQGPPASRAILRHFTTVWTSWAGFPSSIQVDLGKEFLADFSNHLKEFGVKIENTPLEAPWKNGKVEKAGHLWKDIFCKTVHEMQLQGLDDVVLATSIVTQCRNSFPRSNGYAPNQWVLGQPEVRLPGSLLCDEVSQRLEVLEAAEDPSSKMAKSLGIREAARVAQIRLDTDSRVRRALLHQSTPTRGPFPIGSYVYFLRMQSPSGHQKTYRWFGPARVIGCELRSSARLADPEELPTDGGQPRSYWLRYGSTVVLVTGEQLRFASEDELIAAHTIPQEVLEPEYARGARKFVDLRGHLAVPLQNGDPALPEPPQPRPVPLGIPDIPMMPPTPESDGYFPSVLPD